MDYVDERNYQFKIGKKCGNFVDAFIKSISCLNSIGKILLKLTQSELGVFNYTNYQIQLGEILRYC